MNTITAATGTAFLESLESGSDAVYLLACAALAGKVTTEREAIEIVDDMYLFVYEQEGSSDVPCDVEYQAEIENIFSHIYDLYSDSSLKRHVGSNVDMLEKVKVFSESVYGTFALDMSDSNTQNVVAEWTQGVSVGY